jgi:glycosyl transferase family 2
MMIVKDEAHILARCLESARPFVDWWVIADTGSTDGTQQLIRSTLDGVPGQLVERPWVNFGHNRQEVLELARSSPHRSPDDYAIWLDADEQLDDLPTSPTPLDLDGYMMTTVYGRTRYGRLAIIRLDRPWTWRGAIHEHLELPGATLGDLSAPTVRAEHAGARSLDPDTYRKDAALILAALEEDAANPRLEFYLAQSWRDAGEVELALAAYRTRIDNPLGWHQERWYSLFQTAVLRERLGHPAGDVAEAYLEAYQACPWRAEPLVQLARLERGRDRFAVGLMYARAATRIPMPGNEGLFVDSDTYSWRVWDEVAVNGYWVGEFAEGAEAARKALAVRPDDPRLLANLEWCQAKLAAPAG